MPNFFCPHCKANNSRPGQCVICLKGIGNPGEAMRAAVYSTVLLIILWVLISTFIGIKTPVFAVIFGVLVAFCTSRFSGGRGVFYQLVATSFTVLGIVLAEVITWVVYSYQEGLIELKDITLSAIWYTMLYAAWADPLTVLFYVVGVIGSLYILR